MAQDEKKEDCKITEGLKRWMGSDVDSVRNFIVCEEYVRDVIASRVMNSHIQLMDMNDEGQILLEMIAPCTIPAVC